MGVRGVLNVFEISEYMASAQRDRPLVMSGRGRGQRRSGGEDAVEKPETGVTRGDLLFLRSTSEEPGSAHLGILARCVGMADARSRQRRGEGQGRLDS